jgi:hypothetical protein
MKIKNNTKKEVELKDAFTVGDLLRINAGTQDGRGGWDDRILHVILTKINKVTAVGTLEDTGDEVTLDWTDLYYAKIIVQKEILRKNLLQA